MISLIRDFSSIGGVGIENEVPTFQTMHFIPAILSQHPLLASVQFNIAI